jgi:hypothetical protein
MQPVAGHDVSGFTTFHAIESSRKFFRGVMKSPFLPGKSR